jgi:hypothetical protein
MNYRHRLIEPLLKKAVEYFPVVSVTGALCRQLRIFDFLNPLVSDPGKPSLEWFCLVRWDGLDYSEKSFSICAISEISLPVCSYHFQLSDFFGHLKVSFIHKLFLKIIPILSRMFIAGQNFDCINNRKPPLIIMNGFPNFLPFENSNFRVYSPCLF